MMPFTGGEAIFHPDQARLSLSLLMCNHGSPVASYFVMQMFQQSIWITETVFSTVINVIL